MEELAPEDPPPTAFFAWPGELEHWPPLGLVVRKMTRGLSRATPGRRTSCRAAQGCPENAPASLTEAKWPVLAWSWPSRSVTSTAAQPARVPGRRQSPTFQRKKIFKNLQPCVKVTILQCRVTDVCLGRDRCEEGGR